MVIYSKFNNNRKKIYQLVTQIEENNGKIFSTKISSSRFSKKFLNSFLKKYSLLKKNNFSFSPVKPSKVNDTKIKFKYIRKQTLENTLFDALLNRDKDQFINQVKDYFSMVRNNQLKKVSLSENFLSIFSPNLPIKNLKENCIECGCIDLNFNNIFLNKSLKKYFLIDYEWTFDFPVPYKYICFRSLLYFYLNFNDYNPNNFIPIQYFLDILQITPEVERMYLNFEYNFQIFVCGSNFRKIIKLEDYISNYYSSKQATSSSNLFNRLIEPKNQTEDYKLELDTIKSSALYKLWPIYNSIKKLLQK